MVFGSRMSPRIWCTFMGLVVWITIHVFGIGDLLHYMDNVWSYDTNPVLQYYAPHNAFYPLKQCCLLTLWDEIGLSYDKQKQVFGEVLEIVGLYVNFCHMSITMPATSKTQLVSAIWCFIDTSSAWCLSLVEWQQLPGWINWALNIFPLLQPALQLSYTKISRKSHMHVTIYLNHSIIRDLNWVANTVGESGGICMLDAVEWDKDDADMVIYCDTSLNSMGFYCPSLNINYCSSIPANAPLSTNFYDEALCVTSVHLWASQRPCLPHHLLIYTDSMNSVEMFHSLKALDGYNDLLFSIGILMQTRVSL
jgi:hypothetical protein